MTDEQPKATAVRVVKDPDLARGLGRSDILGLLSAAGRVLAGEPRLIDLPARGAAVFVGDTHGDFAATTAVVRRYPGDGSRLVFLGDYVDRGQESAANINYLLCLKLARPESVVLLQGNHEGYAVTRFYPAEFWEGLDFGLRAAYEKTLLRLPLVVSAGRLIALHGALPDLPALAEVNSLEPGGTGWRQVTWGDWQDADGNYLGSEGGRPQFGRQYFDRLMARFGKTVLVRSHQPHVPESLYDGRCVTIFTSRAYLPERTVAVADLEKEITSAADLAIERI